MKNNNVLIIAGAPKAGTTSLHNWLASHPNINGAKLKETRFFLDNDYKLPKANIDNSDAFNFLEFFSINHKNSTDFLLDSSPDYLYCKKPLSIPKYFPNAKVIVILREPTERFISHYNYSKKRGLIDSNANLCDYISMQNNEFIADNEPHLNALSMGKYKKYIDEYRNVFGENLLVLDFVDLTENPRMVLKNICDFLNIQSEFYTDFEFDAHNQTNDLELGWFKLKYFKIRRWVVFSTMKFEFLQMILKKVNKLIKLIFPSLDAKSSRKSKSNTNHLPFKNIDEKCLKMLNQYYGDNS